MDIDDHVRIVHLAEAAGSAEGAELTVNNFLIDLRARLCDEEFSVDLAVEIEEIARRLGRIKGDLSNLAYSGTGKGFGDEIHRLGHRGEEPTKEVAPAA